MKRMALFAFLGVSTLLFGACSSPAPQSTGVSSAIPTETLYRGTIEEVLEDGSIKVAQVDGYHYVQDSIIFHVADTTVQDVDAGEVAEGAYVQVTYNGILTRSFPPQATADTLHVIASHSEGVVQNGTIKEMEKTDAGYTIHLLPFSAPADTVQNQVILTVPQDALEHLAEEDLVAGAEVSAVTKGIAALSLPPQMPVVVLLPYTT